MISTVSSVSSVQVVLDSSLTASNSVTSGSRALPPRNPPENFCFFRGDSRGVVNFKTSSAEEETPWKWWTIVRSSFSESFLTHYRQQTRSVLLPHLGWGLERRGTGSLSSSVDCCYSNLLDLLRVKTRVCSYNLYATPFLSFPSHLTLVKFIKLKRTQSVCTREKEREREKKNRGKTKFLIFIIWKKINSRQKIKIKKYKKCPVTRTQGWGDVLPC